MSEHVLNVIADDARPVAHALRTFGEPHWLSEGRAFDLPFDAEALALARTLPCNANAVPATNRRKKLLIADMDSTIITCECLDELADRAGLKPRIAAITERAMRGEIAFVPALRERVSLLKGLPLAALARTYDERVRLTPGAKVLVATMKAHGARTVLVSGGFSYFTSRVREAAGFDADQANVLIDDGKALTGEVREPVLGREAKLATLQSQGVDPHDVLAVGDGANDLDMIRAAGLGVAFHAKPVVAEAAQARIDHGDLRALLYLQGYSDGEIVG